METTEKIDVYICIQNGKTVCICCRSDKGCGNNCIKDVVNRDKFDGWQQCMRQNKYGK